MPSVVSLSVFPVKSLRGVPVLEATVQKRGFANDRRWLVVEPDGKFVTQRDEPRLATIDATVEGTRLCLSTDGHGSLVIDEPSGPTTTVTVWNSQVEAIDAGQPAADWLTSFFGRDLRLVHMPDSSIRQPNEKFREHGDEVSFADGFPFLLTNEGSLAELNGRLENPVGMERFRANIVVEGFDAFAEDSWKKVTVGAVTFRCPKPCGRCIVTTTDQSTGERGSTEPLATLASYRTNEYGACFGVNLVPDNLGTIQLGDPVRVE